MAYLSSLVKDSSKHITQPSSHTPSRVIYIGAVVGLTEICQEPRVLWSILIELIQRGTARSSSPIRRDYASGYRYWHGVGLRQRHRGYLKQIAPSDCLWSAKLPSRLASILARSAHAGSGAASRLHSSVDWQSLLFPAAA
jgi:hypothetical protein